MILNKFLISPSVSNDPRGGMSQMKSQSETKEFKELMNKSIVAGEPAKQKKMPFGPSKEIRDD